MLAVWLIGGVCWYMHMRHKQNMEEERLRAEQAREEQAARDKARAEDAARREKEREAMPDRLEGGNRFVMHCVQYVESNFSEPISLEEICRRSAMSRTDFCARFRALTGQTFNGYLNACRIKKAAEWLREGRSVSVVSDLCGYRTFSTFYRNFKKIMGVSPREYRAEVQ